ncbi:hypothetical protein L207DRAFT_619448 [Hyaloscypha variabilis F]|uniref:Uncharacterized protein n=1 Tax=Hyaloscypha variabilis (strain UAMH 11265 / GT02V1 / F) TaxID=1149755 RepID=A0A2J6S0Y0_HYAVF|nr:hypothetical protein L207DRAFT_619448 [Hyaloscypha variabilis F]
MSMNQIEPYVSSCPVATSTTRPQAPWVYYFLYAYDECDDFPKICPTAHMVGPAILQDWVWHINVEGKPNVRKMFFNGKDPYQTRARSITVGWVYRVSKAEDERMHERFGVDRVRMGQVVSVTNPAFPHNVCKVPVILYWDPRDTRDSNRWACSLEALLKWEKALWALKVVGVQRWYIDRIRETVNQRKGANFVEDQAINPRDLHYTPPPTFRNAAPLRIRQAQALQAEQVVAGLQAIPNNSTPRPQGTPSKSLPRTQVTANSQSNFRPQPTAEPRQPRPQSAPSPQTTPGPQSANPRASVMTPPPSQRAPTPTPTRTNVKYIKKRKPDASDDEGQPPKKKVQKKPPSGPSNPRHGRKSA